MITTIIRCSFLLGTVGVSRRSGLGDWDPRFGGGLRLCKAEGAATPASSKFAVLRHATQHRGNRFVLGGTPHPLRRSYDITQCEDVASRRHVERDFPDTARCVDGK